MGVFGGGGMNGEEAARRKEIIGAIAAETDVAYLAKLIALDQVDYTYDPCGKSELVVCETLTDMSRKALVRINELLGFSGVKAGSVSARPQDRRVAAMATDPGVCDGCGRLSAECSCG